MSPTLKVLLPKSGSAYPATEPSKVNSSSPTPIDTPHFKGEISVWVKDYNGLQKEGDGNEYFGEPGREGMTYGITVRGRFLTSISADDVLFGNVFEKPVRDHLPWGTSIAMKFMSYIDPTLEMDPYADKPWALAPVLATMNYLGLHKKGTDSSNTTHAPTVVEDSYDAIAELRQSDKGTEPPQWDKNSAAGVKARRKWLASKENRQAVILNEEVETEMEFCNGLLDFNTLDVVLPQPFSLHISLLKYWDGQPATYICRSRDGKTTFWSMAFQIVDKGDVEISESEGTEKTKENQTEKKDTETLEKEVEISKDVD